MFKTTATAKTYYLKKDTIRPLKVIFEIILVSHLDYSFCIADAIKQCYRDLPVFYLLAKLTQHTARDDNKNE